MGTFKKVIRGHELYLYNGKGQLIYKRWLNYGYSKVFDVTIPETDMKILLLMSD